MKNILTTQGKTEYLLTPTLYRVKVAEVARFEAQWGRTYSIYQGGSDEFYHGSCDDGDPIIQCKASTLEEATAELEEYFKIFQNEDGED